MLDTTFTNSNGMLILTFKQGGNGYIRDFFEKHHILVVKF